MAQKKFLVTGATGASGVHTVEQLLGRGHQVRALAHREDDRLKRFQGLGAEVVIGDLLNLNDVRLALSGIRGAYFVYPLSPTLVQATKFLAGFHLPEPREVVAPIIGETAARHQFTVPRERDSENGLPAGPER